MTMFRQTSLAMQALAIAGSLIFALSQSACEKKRGLRFTQGSGDNLYEIQQYNDATFQVTTGERRFKGQTSRADELVTLNNFDKINDLDAVEFTISKGLFAGINISDYNFYGRENFAYTLKYSFTDYYVILSKVAAKADIPSQEMTFATELGNGQYQVPLMGLPISLFTVEQKKDERGKDTRELSTFPRDKLKQASHFKVDAGSLKYFDAPSKPDLFTADFFNTTDEWFFTKTLVGRSIGSASILGSTQASLKIKFAKTNNSLIGVDLNIAQEEQVLDPTKTITALEIPVLWVDFKTDQSGETANLKEHMLDDKTGSAARFWKERKYALVDFNNADRLDKAFTLDNKLEKLEVSDDYISFTIYESKSGNTYKYSLAKSNRKIDGQTMFAEDAKMFHVFTQRRKVIQGALQSQDPDIDKLVYQSRFYPENGEIVYHISKNSPNDQEFTDAVAASIKAWDEAFQKAGTGIRVRLADERVELGDVRYNTIALYGYEIDPGRLLGFGPSVQDTRTGETYSAAVHIYLRAYREGLITSIRNFVRNELGLYDDKSMDQITSFAGTDKFISGGGLIGSAQADLSGAARLRAFLPNTDMFAAESGRSLQTMVFGSSNMLNILDDYEASQKQKDAAKGVKLFDANGPKCEYGAVASVANSWDKIRKVCASGGTKLSDYLSRLKSLHASDSKVLNTEGEDEAILECAQPLMRDLLNSTLIHEVGHNLGLGHNFAGTSDSESNHAKNADGTTAFPSSSVMDYPDRDFDLYNQAGPYDIAAIRFIYTRQVETKDNKLLTVPRNQSMFVAAAKNGKELKPYKMCTDYEFIGDSNLPTYDPLCSRWDVGSTPEKYVQWAISQIHADIIQNGYRYNDKGFSGTVRSLTYLDHFKQIQEYFRFLMRGKAGAYFEKLSGTSSAEKKASLEKMIDDSPVGDRALLKSYYRAVNDIFAFGREIINLPGRVCLVLDQDEKYVDALEFSALRQRIFEQESVTVQTCKQAGPLAAKALTEMRKPYAGQLANLKFLDRSVEVSGLELDLNPAAAADKWKQIAFASSGTDLDPRFSSGSFLLKAAMIQTLTSRESLLLVAQDAGVGSSNFLDYAWFAESLYQDAWSNLFMGSQGERIDAKLLSNQLFQHYQDFVGLTPFYLKALFVNGLVPQSEAFAFARSMQPKKEKSIYIFEQGPGASEKPIWHTTNTANEVLYADSGIAQELIQMYIKIQQFGPSYATYVATNEPSGLSQTLQDLSLSMTSQDFQQSVDDRIYTAAAKYLTSKGLKTLQPAQKALLRAYVKKATTAAAPALALPPQGADPVPAITPSVEDVNVTQAKLVLKVLADFSSQELLDARIATMAFEDPNNLDALYQTLNIILSSF